MDWIVPVSSEESTSGKMCPETLRDALAAFREHGCVLLRGLFAEATVDALAREYASRHGGLSVDAMRDEARKPPPNPVLKVGNARYEITVRLSGEFASPSVFSNGLVRQCLEPLLGDTIHLNSLSVVVSFPGAGLQHIHRDYSLLFEGIGTIVPVYAVNVGVPLIDVDIETGPTGFWPGSHRWPSAEQPEPKSITVAPLLRGDCMLHDFRTMHAGLPNNSDHSRPILYMSYTRPWFFDERNHRGRVPVDLSLGDHAAVPESCRDLLTRALSQALRDRRA